MVVGGPWSGDSVILTALEINVDSAVHRCYVHKDKRKDKKYPVQTQWILACADVLDPLSHVKALIRSHFCCNWLWPGCSRIRLISLEVPMRKQSSRKQLAVRLDGRGGWKRSTRRAIGYGCGRQITTRSRQESKRASKMTN